MGHDISAYLGEADPVEPDEFIPYSDFPEIAYLRRSASSPLRHTLYEVLDAQEFDGDISGMGPFAFRWYSREQLELARRRLWLRRRAGQSVRPEIRFVEDCLVALLPDRGWVFIAFG